MRKEDKIPRILVVDDEPLICMMVARYLRKRALVNTASTADEALHEIMKQHYDLCFLDIIMPGTNTGLDAMKIINEHFQNTKVVIMSAAPLEEVTKKQVGEYAYAHIPKPFSLSDIGAVTDLVAASLN